LPTVLLTTALAGLHWRKTTRSGSGSDCIEIALVPEPDTAARARTWQPETPAATGDHLGEPAPRDGRAEQRED
jgi:hypothetical protein